MSVISIYTVRLGIIERIGIKLGILSYDYTKAPDYWAVNGWTNSLKSLKLNVDAAFLGNSITYSFPLNNYFKEMSVCNLGYPGDDLDGILMRVEMLKAINPKKIFVMGGINGLKDMSEKDFHHKYEMLIQNIKESIPQAQIYIQSILPVNHIVYSNYGDNKEIYRFNQIIKEIAFDNSCEYIDLYDIYIHKGELPAEFTKDGIHLYPKAYDKWANIIKPFMMEGN